jgi:hypothetical protein
MLPACCTTCPLLNPARVPEGDVEPTVAAGPTMPAVRVGRRAETDRPVRLWLRETLTARVPGRRLDPPVPLSVEVAAERVDAVTAEPVRVQEPSPAAVERVDPPLIEALRCYQNKSPEQAAEYLRQCDRAGREMLSCLLPMAVKLAESDIAKADPQDLAALAEQVQCLLTPLRERAALEIPKLCFCRPVTTAGRSGVYELLDENHLFRPGEWVALYMEVRNFTCSPRGEDFRTHIGTAIEIRDEHGQVLRHYDIDNADPSLSPRHDFCNGLRFPLPSLPPGAYTLELKATDVPSGRTAKRSLDFRVTTVPAKGM